MNLTKILVAQSGEMHHCWHLYACCFVKCSHDFCFEGLEVIEWIEVCCLKLEVKVALLKDTFDMRCPEHYLSLE